MLIWKYLVQKVYQQNFIRFASKKFLESKVC